MMFPTAFVALLAAATAHASASDVEASSRLMIYIPYSLRQEDGYNHIPALFGMPPAAPNGASIAQYVYYADSTLCDPNVNTTKGYPSTWGHPWQSPYILMVDRGDCTYVTKVRNAQRAGASGVIIANNICGCSERNCKEKEGESSKCESSYPSMADDGSGDDIFIPSFLMFKYDADRVKDVLMDQIPVLLEMEWSLPNHHRVEYELWTSPSDPFSKSFLSNWKDVAEAFNKKGVPAYFTPHMYIYDGIRQACHRIGDDRTCSNLCTNNGRYCAVSTQDGISGADVVKESLRRLCIWEVLVYEYDEQEDERFVLPWWTYIEEFQSYCSDNYFSDDRCVEQCYERANIDATKVQQCMMDSGGLETDISNRLLDEEIRVQREQGVVLFPTMLVNAVPMREKLSTNNVFHAICSKFEDDSIQICKKCAYAYDVVDCIKTGTGSTELSGAMFTFAVIISIWLLIVTVVLGVVVYWYCQKNRRDGREEQYRETSDGYTPIEMNQQEEDALSSTDFNREER